MPLLIWDNARWGLWVTSSTSLSTSELIPLSITIYEGDCLTGFSKVPTNQRNDNKFIAFIFTPRYLAVPLDA